MKKKFLRACATVGLVCSPLAAQAIEVQVGNRAQTMGMAFTAVADDPSAVFHNPAGLTQIKKTEIDVGVGLQFLTLDYTDLNGITHTSEGIAPVPTVFFSTDKAEPVVLGLGLYVPWGTSAEIDQDAASGFPYMKSALARYDLTLAAAYQFLETVSAGVGFTVGYARFENDVPLDALGNRLDESGSGFGFSGIAGILWQPDSRVRVGLSYRAPMTTETSGEATVAGTTDNFSADIPFPGTLSFGIAVDPIETLTVSLDFDWTHWNYFDEFKRDYDTLPTITQPLNGESAHDFRIGFEYRPLDKTHVRWGYSYQMAGWPEQTILPSELEYPLHVMAVGMSQFFWKMRLDLGYELSLAENRHVEDNINGFNGDYDAIRHIALLTAAFMF